MASAASATPRSPLNLSSQSSNHGAGGKPSGGFGRAAVVTMAMVLLSRVIGMARDTIIAAYYGQNAVTDAYQAAFTIPDLLMYLVAGGALASTFVPTFSEHLHSGDREGASKTFSVVATVTALVAFVLVVIGELAAPYLVILLTPGLAGHKHDPNFSLLHFRYMWSIVSHPYASAAPTLPLAVHLTRILLPAQICFMLGSLIMGVLNANRQFLIPALGPIIYNVGIITGALISRGHGIEYLTWGALIGAFVGNFALQLAFVFRVGLRFRPSLDLSHPGAMKVWALMLPILLGVSLPNVDQIINKGFASLLSEGAMTALMNAVRIMLIPIGVFAQALGIAILPTLSSHAAAGDKVELRKTIVKGLRTILFLTLPSSALVCILAVPIVSIIYQHRVFTYADTLVTAAPLRLYALGIFAWSAQAVLTRSFYSINDSRTPVVSGTVMTVLFIAMNWVVVNHTHAGIAGLAAATTIAATLHTLVMLYYLNRRVRRIVVMPLAVSIVKSLFATGALCLVCAMVYASLRHILGPETRFSTAVILFTLPALLGLTGFVAIARAVNMRELQDILAMVKRRSRVQH